MPRHHEPDRSFIPALRYDLITPLYDVVIRMTLPERRFKLRLVDAAHLTAGHQVLDVGCGTGTLLILAANRAPGANLTGIDADERILSRARRKIDRAGLSVRLDQGSATALPYADGSFDRVISSLVFHHLTAAEKQIAFAEAFRVLRLGGELHLGDFGEPDSRLMRIVSLLTEKVGREHVQENFRGMLPAMARQAGFSQVEDTARFHTAFGVLRCLRAARA